ncbi:MAG: PhoPQ-activated pathogenicity-related family protein [Bryobacteraceae bacterium]
MAIVAVLLISLAAQPETALDRYVARKEAVYGWKQVDTITGSTPGHVLELTSQAWRTEKDVDRPVWKHWLTIVKPKQVRSRTAMLFIGGGSNLNPPPKAIPARAGRVAEETGTIVADLGMVPNQPLRFTDSPEKARSEDDLIAYTRVRHFTTRDDEWLVRLAMVKSAVRAMDAVQEFLASEAGGRIPIDRFVVAGGSKRGWTAWLTGAVDPRVSAIVPLVIDALNSEAITRHHFEVYGFFSPALKDYVNHGLFPHRIGTPEYRAVLDIEDPFQYRRRPRLRIPKYLINAAGDEFFLPDNARFYYRDLPEEKHLRYVPNAKHNLAGSNAVDGMIAFYRTILDGRPRPRFEWKKQSDDSLIVTARDKPAEVKLWQATNPEARDFRLDIIGPAYAASPLAETKPGVYVARVPAPPKGYTAFFAELTFPGGLIFTTEVSVTPDKTAFRFQDAAKKYAATR